MIDNTIEPVGDPMPYPHVPGYVKIIESYTMAGVEWLYYRKKPENPVQASVEEAKHYRDLCQEHRFSMNMSDGKRDMGLGLLALTASTVSYHLAPPGDSLTEIVLDIGIKIGMAAGGVLALWGAFCNTKQMLTKDKNATYIDDDAAQLDLYCYDLSRRNPELFDNKTVFTFPTTPKKWAERQRQQRPAVTQLANA